MALVLATIRWETASTRVSRLTSIISRRRCPRLQRLHRDTVIVQMVAFSAPDWQLPRYIEAMEEAGLTEFFLQTLKGQHDGRLWRSVPGRRWYSAQRGATPGSQEVVLFHRKAAAKLPSAVSEEA